MSCSEEEEEAKEASEDDLLEEKEDDEAKPMQIEGMESGEGEKVHFPRFQYTQVCACI